MMSVGQVGAMSDPAPESMAETPQKKQVASIETALRSIENVIETPQKGQATSIKTGVVNSENGPGEHVCHKIDFRTSNTSSTFASETCSTDESSVPEEDYESEQEPACLNRRASGLIQSSEGLQQSLDHSRPLSIVIFGATGDLARKKLFPALYQLVVLKHFPKHLNIVGYGRRAVVLEEFCAQQCANVLEDPRFPKGEFLSQISFHAGGYDSLEAFQGLDSKLKEYEGGKPGNRLFFLSVPPSVFGSVCQMVSKAASSAEGGFTHLIIEKPFGTDSASFNELNQCTRSLFAESQLYRIDHYLGKEVILNMLTLRFANQIFEPLWNSKHIESVEITVKEDIGTGGRGGYFDGVGIIRDMMQSHLLQVFMLCAMERPASMTAADITAAKRKLLKEVEALTLESGVFLGQFAKGSCTVGGQMHTEPGYLDDPTVPEGSKCPTFAAVVLRVNNTRWKGVPFLMTAGKGLDERLAVVRVRFRPSPLQGPSAGGNELIMRIQPDEALYLKTFTKEPGLDQIMKPTIMDMSYSKQFPGARVADAYERMLLAAATGDGSLFTSTQELTESWRIFTPLLHEIDRQKADVVLYPFGSRYPPGFDSWSEDIAGVVQSENFWDIPPQQAKDSCI